MPGRQDADAGVFVLLPYAGVLPPFKPGYFFLSFFRAQYGRLPPATAPAAEREKILHHHEQNHARTHSGDSEVSSANWLIRGGGDGEDEEGIKRVCLTTEEKQKLSGRHLNNVAELVRDLREDAVFAAGGGA